MDRKLDTAGAQTDKTAHDVANRGEYMERMQGMVDGIQDGEKREAAQSALNEVGKDLGFAVAKDAPQQEQGLERQRDFDREV